MKTCTVCGIDRGLNEYYFIKRLNRYEARCKFCKQKYNVKYAKEYRIKNKQTIFEQKKQYRERNRESIKEKKRLYRLENKEYLIQKSKEKYWRNVDKNRESCRKYYEAHKKEFLLASKIYKAEHKDEYRIYYINSRLRRRAKIGSYGNVSTKIVSELRLEQNNKCFYCKKDLENFHIDHYIPISKGGKHIKENLRLSCPKCNLRKHNKDPEVFINKILREAI